MIMKLIVWAKSTEELAFGYCNKVRELQFRSNGEYISDKLVETQKNEKRLRRNSRDKELKNDLVFLIPNMKSTVNGFGSLM